MIGCCIRCFNSHNHSKYKANDFILNKVAIPCVLCGNERRVVVGMRDKNRDCLQQFLWKRKVL